MKILPTRSSAAAALSAALLAVILPAAPAAAGGCGDTPGIWHLHGESGEAFAMRIGEVGIWRPGPPAPKPSLQVPVKRANLWVGVEDDGRSVLDFERYELEGETYYALVYQAGEAKEKLLGNLAGAGELVAAIGAEAGMQLEDFEAFREDGQWHYAALFRQGSAERFFETEVKASEVAGKLADRHLIDFEILSRNSGEPTFALLLAPGKRDQLFFPSLGAEEFHQRAHQPSAEPNAEYRLEDVEVWRSALGGPRFSALFEKAGLADHLWVSRCGLHCNQKSSFAQTAADLEKRIDALHSLKSTVRLVDLELPLDPEESKPPLGDRRGKGPAAARKPARSGGLGLGNTPPDDQCTHAGVLHDAGTDGPP